MSYELELLPQMQIILRFLDYLKKSPTLIECNLKEEQKKTW